MRRQPGPPSDHPLLIDWYTDLQAEGKALNTCYSYVHDLEKFSTFMHGKLATTKYPDVLRYNRSMVHAGTKVSTRSRKVTALRMFFRWLARAQGKPQSITEYLRPPKRQRHLHRWWTLEQIEQFRGAFTQGDETTRRDRAMCELGLMGLRVGEVVALNLEHLISLEFPSRAAILVRRKGNKEQLLPLSADARQALRQWLQMRPKVPTPALFHRLPFRIRGRERLTYAWVEKMFSRRAEEAGLALHRQQNFHILRHSTAQRLADLGVPLQEVQTLLGHESSRTTQIYFIVSDARLRKTVQRLQYDGDEG